MKHPFLTGITLLLLANPWPGVAAAGFTALDLPGSQLIALSEDGRIAAGGLVGAPSGGFRWSAEHGVELLEGAVSVQGLSASGRHVAGSALDADQGEIATYWDAAGSAHAIGEPPGPTARGGVVSVAFGITDEPRAVGMTRVGSDRSAAFEWAASGGLHLLPLPDTATSARVAGLSRDGHRLYGWLQHGGMREGVLWEDGVPRLLRNGDGSVAGEVLGANRDASTLLGIDSAKQGNVVAYRWETLKGAQPLAYARSDALYLFAGSDDGSVLVGSRGAGADREAIVWTAQANVQTLRGLLAAHNVAIPGGWRLLAATAISGEGNRIGGWGLCAGRMESFVVELEPQ